MSKEKLDFEYNSKFKIVAISTHLKDYRVSFFINELLQITLEKVDDLIVDNKKKNVVHAFEMQYFENEQQDLEYFLIHNKSVGICFLPSLKKFDYLLLLKSENIITNQEEIVSILNQNKHFHIVYKVEELSVREKNIVERNIIYKENEN